MAAVDFAAAALRSRRSVLAARAAEEARVALLDLNADQANLTQWWFSRGEPDNPQLFECRKPERGYRRRKGARALTGCSSTRRHSTST